jgi:cytidylate kinase
MNPLNASLEEVYLELTRDGGEADKALSPSAPLSLFLSASPSSRAQRRSFLEDSGRPRKALLVAAPFS